MSLAYIGGMLVDLIVVSGVVWPWYDQARILLKSRDTSKFSKLTPLILLVSATLRIFYWIGARYGTPLLIQAVASIMTQLAMLWVVVKVENGPQRGGPGVTMAPRRRVERSFLDFRAADFWKWTDWESFLLFELCLVVVAMTVTGVFHPASWYTSALGTLSLGIEAMLPLPQAVENHKQKKNGLSLVVLGSWVAGDAFKTAYAFFRGEALPFILCGSFQLLVDFFLVSQTLVYGNGGGDVARE
jgi:hypothetical protein